MKSKKQKSSVSRKKKAKKSISRSKKQALRLSNGHLLTDVVHSNSHIFKTYDQILLNQSINQKKLSTAKKLRKNLKI